MEKSADIKNLAVALSNFQAEVETIKKHATNPFFKSKYATLNSIIEAVREPLFKNGLSITQFPTGEHCLTTMLLHNSGQYIQETYCMQPVKNDPQGLGSTITYQRRYALASILCLNIDEDDDGNTGSQPKKQQSKNQSNTPATSATFPQLNSQSEKWRGAVEALATGTVTLERLKKSYSIFDYNEKQLLKEVEQYKNQTP